MRAYRYTVNFKLGLVVFAVGIAVASLVYTNHLAGRLRQREAFMVALQARAFEEQARLAQSAGNPHGETLPALDDFLARASGLDTATRARFREATAWAMTMPPPGEVTFLYEQVIRPNLFEIPVIQTDGEGAPIFWRNVPIDTALAGRLPAPDSARLRRLAADMDAVHQPVPLVLSLPGVRIEQRIHYGDSALVRELRLFPYIQLAFVALFVLAGYLGFSYVRRSEQSSLWAGMAKEAAHQLGTPISSLMGWAELLRADPDAAPGETVPNGALVQEAVVEIDKDIARLNRVTQRFSSIGSVPKLTVQPLAPVVAGVADYLRRRIPASRHVALTVDVPEDLRAALHGDLFEWVVENLVKNALDAIDAPEGRIEVTARRVAERICLDVRDTGRGIDRRHFQNVFRPGFSTKKRGWGLGLSLARRIVEHYHGGRLRLVASKPGAGTTFRIDLPAR